MTQVAYQLAIAGPTAVSWGVYPVFDPSRSYSITISRMCSPAGNLSPGTNYALFYNATGKLWGVGARGRGPLGRRRAQRLAFLHSACPAMLPWRPFSVWLQTTMARALPTVFKSLCCRTRPMEPSQAA